MNGEVLRDMERASRSVNWRALKIAAALLALAGAAGFLFGVLGPESKRAWQAYLVNFIYWTGLSMGAFLLSPILVLTNAHWGRPVKRLAEAAGAFIPVSFFLFWVLYAGRETIFPWISSPPHTASKQFWLQVPFLFLRDGTGLLIMALLFLRITAVSLKGDLELLRGQSPSAEKYTSRQVTPSAAFSILYAFILTLLAFDLVMSLNPEWVSTLFGAYYFAGSFYTGLATMILFSVFAVEKMGLGAYITRKHFHDLGKLLFAFCIVCADFFYVQFLVIWYGNMPDETRFVITRVIYDPWALLAWTVLLMCYVVPFIVLLLRKIKMTNWMIAAMSIWVLTGMWIERFFLITPSIWKGPSIPLGLLEIVISLGFLGIFVFCAAWFLAKFPVMPVSDPLFPAVAARKPAETELSPGVDEAV